MLKSIKWNATLMIYRKNFMFSFTFMLCISIFNVIYALLCQTENGYSKTVDKYFAYIFCNGNILISFLYIIIPLILILPYSIIDFSNKHSHLSIAIKHRMGIKRYYISQFITSFFSGFVVTFIPLMIGFIFNLIFLPNSKNAFNGNRFFIYLTQISPKNFMQRTKNPYIMLYPKYFLDNPITYTIIYILALSIFFGLCACFCYTVSFKLKRVVILSVIPIEIAFFMGLLQKNNFENKGGYIGLNYNILDYFTINSSPGKNFLFITIVMLLMIFISVFLLYQQINKDQFEVS